MMRYAFDRFLPSGMTWRELFDLVIVGARKPEFFTAARRLFEVVDDESGLLRAARRPAASRAAPTSAATRALVERALGLSRRRDPLRGRPHVRRRARDQERAALAHRARSCASSRTRSRRSRRSARARRVAGALMEEKEALEHAASRCAARAAAPRRTATARSAERRRHASCAQTHARRCARSSWRSTSRSRRWPRQAAELGNPRWGLLMRAGNDKSHLARQIERYADIYTSRVSNFCCYTPFVYLRSPRGSLPHDSGPEGGASG